MNSSDIIAIVAVVVSAIVSITATIFSYLNNKSNIKAKRVEMAFERQLNALSAVAEKLRAIETFLITEGQFISEFEEFRQKLIAVVVKMKVERDRQEVFLPESIVNHLYELEVNMTESNELLEKKDLPAYIEKYIGEVDNVLSAMRHFIETR